jgi:hypothetical protein
MRRVSLGVCVLLCSAVFAGAVAVAQQAASYPPGPVPAAILSAKSVFIANGGADGGLFPSPFSGDPNRGYDEFYARVQKAGMFQLVSDPAQADLVMQIRLLAPYGPQQPSKQLGAADPRPTLRLEIYDTRSHFLIWAITQPVEMAVLQKTHDRNFDESLSVLVTHLQELMRPQTATAH